MNGVDESHDEDHQEAASPRTEQEVLAEIKKLAWELTDHRARNQVLMAVQQAEDWNNGKDS